MNKELLTTFTEKEVEPLLMQVLAELEVSFQQNKEPLKKAVVESFRVICKNIEENKDSMEVGFMIYTLLRTKILQRDYQYVVMIYDKEWYLHDGVEVGTLDVSFIFGYFERFWQELLKASKKYILQISIVDVEHMVLNYLEPFHEYVLELLRYSLIEVTETEAYKLLNKAALFQIQSGEYYEPCDLVHIEGQEKNVLQIRKWLKENERSTYCFQDFKEMDFKDLTYSNCDLRYTDFRGSDLEGINLRISLLIGTKFKGCGMKGANLMTSMIHNANFEQADLTEANLQYCVAFVGKNEMNEWKTVGFTGTSFKGSNLKRASFKGATLSQVDFRGACLEEADFEEATLYGSLFTSEQIKQCRFTEKQLEQMKIVY